LAVYVDEAIWRWAGKRWCHLVCADIDELHRFAARLGITRMSYQGPPRTSIPHYDLTGMERSRALSLGAIAADRATVVTIVRRLRVRSPRRTHDAKRTAA
jgi:hypothetical protein